ncbi:aspartyl protease family protein 1-like protein [Cinnamomum micranthum f. kanehirae]|uniref:Aspartyl protease family protein 1-like protein n=1 Tax=Cinnamomum micranthum f. kanehirae TaxID=337451 RepID=A0A3S4P384_9MAGN|nr:aspartyl protease family protein 1-like protein [Cinnamomum micranthum f. kanehirae]
MVPNIEIGLNVRVQKEKERERDDASQSVSELVLPSFPRKGGQREKEMTLLRLPSIRLLLFHQVILFLFFFFFISQRTVVVDGQVPIPPRYDGFVYRKSQGTESIVVEAFFDPLCPDSRDAWPPLKQALTYYACNRYSLSLIVHPFPLPYHDNAFVACRALHIANGLNTSTTYPLLELFFKYQGWYYNKPTHTMSRAAVVDRMVKLVVEAVGNSSLSTIESGFVDAKTDSATRISFKYGCSRGVTGTPYFFVNGFPLPGSGSALNYDKWRSILDPLLRQRKETEPLHFF